MKVVMVGTFGLFPKGTMRARALPLARALTKRGHQVTLLLPPWDHPSDSGREEVVDGVRIVNVTLPPSFFLSLYGLTTFRLLRRLLREKTQVVHLFKPKGFSGLIGMLLWFLRGLGLVKTRIVQDSDDWEGTGGWNELKQYPPLMKAFFAFQERWLLRHADALTVASRTLENMAQGLGVPAQRIFYLPNGIDCSRASPADQATASPPAEATLLLYTRFVEFAVERVLELFTAILGRVPQARLLVVGRGFFGEEALLERLAKERGVSERITLTGWSAPEDLPSYFQQATVALYPCDNTLVNQAKCSVKLIELLAAGVPVVAECVGQIPEYIVRGESGLLVEPGDSVAFVDAVVQLLQDQALCRHLRTGAQQRIWDHFRWDLLAPIAETAFQG